MTEFQLPIVDLDGGASTDARRSRAAEELDRAFSEVGFCYITNTGILSSIVTGVFEANQQFHALDAQTKNAIEINEYHRGYMAPKTSLIRTSSVAKVTRPNLSESFLMLHEVSPDAPEFGQPLQGPNQWPVNLLGFRGRVELYNRAMLKLARTITELVARALGLDDAHLLPYFERPTTWLRLLHYPPQPIDSEPEQYGAAPHTDYGFLTILAQDAIGGLQVRNRNGQWIDAAPLPDTFVVNVADMLARWTNDRWVSTPHRVRNLSTTDRYSVPFFLGHDDGRYDRVFARMPYS